MMPTTDGTDGRSSPLFKRSVGDTSTFPYSPIPSECIASHREHDRFRVLPDFPRPSHLVFLKRLPSDR